MLPTGKTDETPLPPCFLVIMPYLAGFGMALAVVLDLWLLLVAGVVLMAWVWRVSALVVLIGAASCKGAEHCTKQLSCMLAAACCCDGCDACHASHAPALLSRTVGIESYVNPLPHPSAVPGHAAITSSSRSTRMQTDGVSWHAAS